jgi:uncharacterized protein DUF1573/methylamine utilization protein MauE
MTDPQRDNRTTPERPSRRGWTIVRLIVAAVLLGAAVLKAHELVTRPVLNQDLLSYRWSLSLQVLFELGLGLTLALGVFRRLIWATTVAAFLFFCLITIYKGLSGEASCGCFGVVQVNPWYTLILDVAIVVWSLVFRPSLDPPATTSNDRGHRRRLAVGIVLFLVAGIPVSIAMLGYEPSRLDTSGNIVGDEQFVVLEPETWVGKQFPLAGHIDSGDQLMTGRWTVVLFSHDCPGCQELVPQLVDRIKGDTMAAAMGRLALVELPPYGPRQELEEKEKLGATYCRLSEKHDWFVGTPVVLLLEGGLVIAAKESTTEVPEFLTAKSGEGDFEPIESKPGDSAPPIAMIVPVAIDRGIVAHDFGAVATESVHEVTFDVRNTTDAAIGIRKVTSECTCMTADVAPGEIPPGETIRVAVTFAAPKKPQVYDKRLLLFTTRQRPSKLILRIKARVGSPLAK